MPMLIVFSIMAGIGVALLGAAFWFGIDLVIGMQTLTNDRLAGLMLIGGALGPCVVGALLIYEEMRSC